MASKWLDVPLDGKLFENVKEACLTRAHAAMENAFINETKGQSRFPGLKPFITLTGNAPAYLHEWRGDLMAVTQGRLYRINQSGVAEDVTGIPIAGGQRVIFDRTDDELLMAAGGQIIRFAGDATEVLSEDAPEATHVGYVDGYVVANERDSGRFWHSNAGAWRTWEPLSVFTANSQPDNINAILVTPFRELLLAGVDSIEQYERLASGTTPFFRRWGVGEGLAYPYTFVAADNASWGINKRFEFARFSGQLSQPASTDIGRSLETIDDWTDAWSAEIGIVGQKFILLAIPYATNVYGTEGVTLVYDYRQKRWFNLFGWGDGVPGRWPGWSYYALWGRHFVGGPGAIYELDPTVYTNLGEQQRVLVRSAHFDDWGESRVDNVRMRIKRGATGSNGVEPKIYLRARRDNTTWTNWVQKGLGLAGHSHMVIEFGGFGSAHTWQFEYQLTDAAEWEVASLQALVTQLGY